MNAPIREYKRHSSLITKLSSSTLYPCKSASKQYLYHIQTGQQRFASVPLDLSKAQAHASHNSKAYSTRMQGCYCRVEESV